MARPRVLDAACTALPYVYGSQRRGQPNLARALGVHNLNESAGGFAGLATLIWLAPLAWSARRVQPRVRFLAALTVFGFLGAFRLPPVDNLLRGLPVLGVTDNRRLTLWVACGLVTLGGIGLDRLSGVRRSGSWSTMALGWVAASVALLAAAGGVGRLEHSIRAKAIAHYSKASESTPGADPRSTSTAAERQVRETLDFVPLYVGLAATQGLVLASLLWAIRRRRLLDNVGRVALLGLTMVDLLGFGYGLNPAIDPSDDRPITPVLAALQREVGRTGRIIGLGAELPPNTLMRYGLADARNYDSVELTRSLDWLSTRSMTRASTRRPAVERSPGLESSRAVSGSKRPASRAVVSPTAPPSSQIPAGRAGRFGLGRLARSRPDGGSGGRSGRLSDLSNDNGRIVAKVDSMESGKLIVRETFDPGWRAELDGRPAADRGASRFFPDFERPGRVAWRGVCL